MSRRAQLWPMDRSGAWAPGSATPRAGDLVELAPDRHGHVPLDVALSLFRRSRNRRSWLLLNRVPHRLVNAALDGHVPYPSLSHRGVRYVSLGDVEGLRAALLDADRAWLLTNEARRAVRGLRSCERALRPWEHEREPAAVPHPVRVRSAHEGEWGARP